MGGVESLVCGPGSVLCVSRLSESRRYSILRNLTLSLPPLHKRRRGPLHPSAAMPSQTVHEDLFVPGKCFPQLANPPLSKLHYL